MNIRTDDIKKQLYGIIALSIAGTGSVVAFEGPPQVHVSELVSPQLAQSVEHRVEDAVLHGNRVTFLLESNFGSHDIQSIPMLRKRVREITILARAQSQGNVREEAPQEYTAGEYRVSADSAVDLISRPVSTAGNVAEQMAESLGETLSGRPSRASSTYRAEAYELDDPVATMHKRNIANQWGLDVYSSNPAVQVFLNDAARARSAGRISAGAPVLNRQRIKPLKVEDRELETRLYFLLKNNATGELQTINRDLLKKMNIGQASADRFLASEIYSPSYQTRIVHYLDQLTGVRNRSAFFEATQDAASETDALMTELSAMSLVYYHENIDALQQIHHTDRLLQAVTRENRIVSLVTADMLYWSEETADRFTKLLDQIKNSGFKGRELLIFGDITEEAAAQLAQQGFRTREQFIY